MRSLIRLAASFQTWFGATEKLIKLLTWLGIPLLGWAGAWLAKTTEFLSPYAPYSWLLSGLVVATLCAVIAWAFAGSLRQVALYRALQQIDRPVDAINPLDDVFTKRRIRLQDLAYPGAGPVRNKTFVDCELVGPAVFFLGANCSVIGVNIINCDMIRVANGVSINNGIAFEDVAIRGGKLIGATIYIHQDNAHRLPGANFVA